MAQPDADTHRQKAQQYEQEIDAIKGLIDELRDADAVGETCLSKHFHEARTSRKRTWNKATAFINITDGEVEVAKISKLRDGRWAPQTVDQYDVVLNVPVRPFLDTQTYIRTACDNLRQAMQAREQNRQQAIDCAQRIEARQAQS